MSENLSLKERLARLGPGRDFTRPPLGPDESILVVLRRTGALDRPVSVARPLFAAALTLKQAHNAINQLAAVSRTVCAVSLNEDLRLLATELAAMNVELRRRL